MLRAGDPPAPSLALVAGLALIEAAAMAAPEAPLSLKWPNDLMRGNAKLAGILLERSGDRVVAGFGVNLAVAPDVPERATAALFAAQPMAPTAFAPLLAGTFARRLAAWRSGDGAALIAAWEDRAHPRGTPLQVHAGAGMIAGRFEGLESDGALRLRREDGTLEIIRAGDVDLA